MINYFLFCLCAVCVCVFLSMYCPCSFVFVFCSYVSLCLCALYFCFIVLFSSVLFDRFGLHFFPFFLLFVAPAVQGVEILTKKTRNPRSRNSPARGGKVSQTVFTN